MLIETQNPFGHFAALHNAIMYRSLKHYRSYLLANAELLVKNDELDENRFCKNIAIFQISMIDNIMLSMEQNIMDPADLNIVGPQFNDYIIKQNLS